MLTIKNFNATDYEFIEIARIDNLVNHDSISHPDNDKNDWRIRDRSLVRDRLLLYKDEKLIGVLFYSQGREQNHRTTFFTIHLDPKYNFNGYRKLLYDNMLQKIIQYNSNKLLTNVYDHPNYVQNLKLLKSESFQLVQTNREYVCNIQNVNTKKYYPLIEKLRQDGINFYDSKEEMLDFNNHYEKLEKLEWEIDQDVPIPDGIKHTRMPFEQWKKVCIDFYENSYGVDIVAVKNGKYIGSTCLSIYPKSDPYKAWTESLGVIRNYRRRGLATALKILAIEKLLNKGVKEIRTDNEENNPMYKINESLGFKAVPFSMDYMKVLKND
tara:strand:- start:141 stop:1115 length:975 start_codon:yes stop_codon:yes gene_type:complete